MNRKTKLKHILGEKHMHFVMVKRVVNQFFMESKNITSVNRAQGFL